MKIEKKHILLSFWFLKLLETCYEQWINHLRSLYYILDWLCLCNVIWCGTSVEGWGHLMVVCLFSFPIRWLWERNSILVFCHQQHLFDNCFKGCPQEFCLSLILVLKIHRQVDLYVFEASLVYRVSSRPVRAIEYNYVSII